MTSVLGLHTSDSNRRRVAEQHQVAVNELISSQLRICEFRELPQRNWNMALETRWQKVSTFTATLLQKCCWECSYCWKSNGAYGDYHMHGVACHCLRREGNRSIVVYNSVAKTWKELPTAPVIIALGGSRISPWDKLQGGLKWEDDEDGTSSREGGRLGVTSLPIPPHTHARQSSLLLGGQPQPMARRRSGDDRISDLDHQFVAEECARPFTLGRQRRWPLQGWCKPSTMLTTSDEPVAVSTKPSPQSRWPQGW